MLRRSKGKKDEPGQDLSEKRRSLCGKFAIKSNKAG
jgi:hypothetical protein